MGSAASYVKIKFTNPDMSSDNPIFYSSGRSDIAHAS